jgi:hypothetical protein
VCIV